jgi:hypothetical protein
MNPEHGQDKKKNPPDFSMLLAGLEKQIMDQKDPFKIARILKDERIWRALTTRQQLKWSNLAQMAGEVETACRVLTHIHQFSPNTVEAWKDHFLLLSVLDNKKELARVLALSRKYLDEKIYLQWVKKISDTSFPDLDRDLHAASRPFETLRNRQVLLGRYLELFSGREDCFARQWVDKKQNKQGYVPVRRPMEHQDLEEHFKGVKTYGMYLIKCDGGIKTAVMDVDLVKDFRAKRLTSDEKNRIKREYHYFIERITELSEQAGLRPLIEFSGGKGYHFWYFFSKPVEPVRIRSVLEHIKRMVASDLSTFNLEVFPKQDHLSGKGLGNLVKLPLGVHRLSGKQSYFIRCHNRSVEAQLDFLANIHLSDPEHLKAVENDRGQKTVFIHPRWEKWAESFPELFSLERKCPPLSQIMATCRNAKTLTIREEKILFQTIGFLPGAKTLLHHLLSSLSEYNPHLVDYRLSRVRGTPMGCKRIHSLLNYTGDWCQLNVSGSYQHPLLHLEEWIEVSGQKSEKVENLSSALENLKSAIVQTQRFMK